MTAAVAISDQPLGEVVAALGGEAPTPAAGSAAAATLAIAAGLVAKCARKAVGRVDDAEGTLAHAEGWERRALELADEDAECYREVLRARRSGGGAEAMSRAVDPPLEIAALAVEVAAAAADLVGGGRPWLRGDAHAAALLAESVARSVARLATLNLAALGAAAAGDERWGRAQELATAAERFRALAERALAGSADDG